MNREYVFDVELSLDMVTLIASALHKDGEFPYVKEEDGELYGYVLVGIKAARYAVNTYSVIVKRCGLLN